MKLPEQKQRTSKFEPYAYQLKTNPGEWQPFPNQHKYSQGVINTYRSRINNGELLGYGYEAATRNGTLYARYNGIYQEKHDENSNNQTT